MAPRSTAQRVADTQRILETEEDAWVATASADGTPHLVPLSVWWDGSALIMTTSATSVTARNLARGERVRLALGPTRDVVMIVGTAAVTPVADDPETADQFVARFGWDPRDEAGEWILARVVPERIQAWRESDEIAGRTVMRDGAWLA
jgi:general stress protein 26